MHLDVIKSHGGPRVMSLPQDLTCTFSHNGVVIEPDRRVGPQAFGEENAGESSRSRSCTPGSKNKARPPPAVASAPGALPGYYRQQGINAGEVVA